MNLIYARIDRKEEPFKEAPRCEKELVVGFREYHTHTYPPSPFSQFLATSALTQLSSLPPSDASLLSVINSLDPHLRLAGTILVADSEDCLSSLTRVRSDLEKRRSITCYIELKEEEKKEKEREAQAQNDEHRGGDQQQQGRGSEISKSSGSSGSSSVDSSSSHSTSGGGSIRDLSSSSSPSIDSIKQVRPFSSLWSSKASTKTIPFP